MVKRRPAPVNKTPAPSLRSLLMEQALIWVPLATLALAVYLTGLDNALAFALYNPESSFGWAMRQHSTLPATLLAVGALIALFWPRLHAARPLLYQVFAVILITTVLGAGLLNQVIVQEIADRPRPRDSVLTSSVPVNEVSGNSMPSGHAAMGFALAAPFFVLRRKKPAAAKAILAIGLAAGFLIGLARMVLGAHFASDVLIAGALTLSSASLAAYAASHWFSRIPRRVLAALAVVGTFCIVLFNSFTVTLSHPLPQGFRRAEIPCQINAIYSAITQTPTLLVTLRGYGAPVSTLALTEQGGVIRLRKSLGLYHSLSCTARLNLPIGPYE